MHTQSKSYGEKFAAVYCCICCRYFHNVNDWRHDIDTASAADAVARQLIE